MTSAQDSVATTVTTTTATTLTETAARRLCACPAPVAQLPDVESENGPSDEEPFTCLPQHEHPKKWCNHVRRTKCPYDTCQYLHLDEYAGLEEAARERRQLQPLMTRHAAKAYRSYLLDLSLVRVLGLAPVEQLRDKLVAVGEGMWNTNRVASVAPAKAICVMLQVTLETLQHDMDASRNRIFRFISQLETLVSRVARLWQNKRTVQGARGLLAEYFEAHDLTHKLGLPHRTPTNTRGQIASTDYRELYDSIF